MRVNYILIDLENVQPDSLEAFDHDHFKVIVFVGATQTKIPLEVAAALQRLGQRAQYVKVSASGRNALDFHLAFYLGRLSLEVPAARFHIISKDTGFDPLITHLKSMGVNAGRYGSVGEIAVTKTSGCAASLRERVAIILARLERMKAAKPRRVATLSSTIASLFNGQLSDQEIGALVQALASKGHLRITGEVVSYLLPDPNQPAKAASPSSTPEPKA